MDLLSAKINAKRGVKFQSILLTGDSRRAQRLAVGKKEKGGFGLDLTIRFQV